MFYVYISVIIKGSNLKGLMVQARVVGAKEVTIVGTWRPPTFVKTIECDNKDDTVTHKDTVKKNDLTLAWTAPDHDVGDVEFV